MLGCCENQRMFISWCDLGALIGSVFFPFFSCDRRRPRGGPRTCWGRRSSHQRRCRERNNDGSAVLSGMLQPLRPPTFSSYRNAAGERRERWKTGGEQETAGRVMCVLLFQSDDCTGMETGTWQMSFLRCSVLSFLLTKSSESLLCCTEPLEPAAGELVA